MEKGVRWRLRALVCTLVLLYFTLWTLPYGVTLLSGCQELRAEG